MFQLSPAASGGKSRAITSANNEVSTIFSAAGTSSTPHGKSSLVFLVVDSSLFDLTIFFL